VRARRRVTVRTSDGGAGGHADTSNRPGGHGSPDTEAKAIRKPDGTTNDGCCVGGERTSRGHDGAQTPYLKLIGLAQPPIPGVLRKQVNK
jgi:hypothetical protein